MDTPQTVVYHSPNTRTGTSRVAHQVRVADAGYLHGVPAFKTWCGYILERTHIDTRPINSVPCQRCGQRRQAYLQRQLLELSKV